jgi:2-polyprenyl-6-methoxyphenol hydroxylase-like FAD-dependent oxidoreductase
MYKSLPDAARSKVLTGKGLDSIESTDDGVTVRCTDGSIYQGSTAIDAVGGNSRTRHLMRDIALKEDPQREWDPEQL